MKHKTKESHFLIRIFPDIFKLFKAHEQKNIRRKHLDRTAKQKSPFYCYMAHMNRFQPGSENQR
jgi:hypothetical protein